MRPSFTTTVALSCGSGRTLSMRDAFARMMLLVEFCLDGASWIFPEATASDMSSTAAMPSPALVAALKNLRRFICFGLQCSCEQRWVSEITAQYWDDRSHAMVFLPTL